MRYNTFGRRTGLRVSELALGAANFGTTWGYGCEPAEARKIFDTFSDAGGNFIDTSDNYQFGQSEELVGEFVANDRDRFVIATKFTQGAAAVPEISQTGNSRKNMIRSAEASLRRLKTDRIDLYWAHMTDGQTPMDEILRAFDDLVKSGKILHAGLSNFPAWRVARGSLEADMRNWTPLVGLQFEYSLAERSADRELLPMAQALGLGVALWSPLGGGLLTGKYRNNEAGRLTTFGALIHQETTAGKIATVDALVAVANEIGCAVGHVAIAWLREKATQSPTALIPILGPRTPSQLKDTLGGLDVRLDEQQIARLDRASAVELGVPHDMVSSDRYRAKLSGGKPDQLDPPIHPVA